ncbi:hypothetical protein JCM33374_g6166 [Metschnikowia sp. JCM 33374]|nr:hypothetical protein JCM33374_g6166 [Metschnikowia sp. JCM 33374]
MESSSDSYFDRFINDTKRRAESALSQQRCMQHWKSKLDDWSSPTIRIETFTLSQNYLPQRGYLSPRKYFGVLMARSANKESLIFKKTSFLRIIFLNTWKDEEETIKYEETVISNAFYRSNGQFWIVGMIR